MRNLLIAGTLLLAFVGIAWGDVITEALFDTANDPTVTKAARGVVLTKPTQDGNAVLGTPEYPLVVAHDTPQFVRIIDGNGRQVAISTTAPSDAEYGLGTHARLWAKGPSGTLTQLTADSTGRLNVAPISIASRSTSAVIDGTTNSAALSSCANETTVNVQVTGTFVGTYAFETSLDGVSWFRTGMYKADGGGVVTTGIAPGFYQGNLKGTHFRVVWDAYTSGEATVKLLTRSGG